MKSPFYSKRHDPAGDLWSIVGMALDQVQLILATLLVIRSWREIVELGLVQTDIFQFKTKIEKRFSL